MVSLQSLHSSPPRSVCEYKASVKDALPGFCLPGIEEFCTGRNRCRNQAGNS